MKPNKTYGDVETDQTLSKVFDDPQIMNMQGLRAYFTFPVNANTPPDQATNLADGYADLPQTEQVEWMEPTGFVSPNTQSHQGYTTDGRYHYTVDTDHIYKWDEDWNLVAENTSPTSDVSQSAVDHMGDPLFYKNELWNACEDWEGCGSFPGDNAQTIGVWDPSDLTFKREYDISANGHEVSSIAGIGKDSELYITDYCDAGNLAHVYAEDGTYKRAVSASEDMGAVQGITYNSELDLLFLTSDSSDEIYAAELDGTVHGTVLHTLNSDGAFEGLDFTQNELRVLLDQGAGEKKIHYVDWIERAGMRGVRFDGSTGRFSEKATAESRKIAQLHGDLTVVAFAAPTDTNKNVIATTFPGDSYYENMSYELYTTDRVGFFHEYNDGSNQSGSQPADVNTDGTLQMFGQTRDANSKTYEMWHNDEKLGSNNYDHNPNGGWDAVISLGRSQTSQRMTGVITGVLIFDRKLSDAEMEQLADRVRT